MLYENRTRNRSRSNTHCEKFIDLLITKFVWVCVRKRRAIWLALTRLSAFKYEYVVNKWIRMNSFYFSSCNARIMYTFCVEFRISNKNHHTIWPFQYTDSLLTTSRDCIQYQYDDCVTYVCVYVWFSIGIEIWNWNETFSFNFVEMFLLMCIIIDFWFNFQFEQRQNDDAW